MECDLGITLAHNDLVVILSVSQGLCMYRCVDYELHKGRSSQWHDLYILPPTSVHLL